MLRLGLRIILLILLFTLIYVVLDAFGYSLDHVGWFIVGVFREYQHIFLHPIALLIAAILLVVAILNAMKQR